MASVRTIIDHFEVLGSRYLILCSIAYVGIQETPQQDTLEVVNSGAKWREEGNLGGGVLTHVCALLLQGLGLE